MLSCSLIIPKDGNTTYSLDTDIEPPEGETGSWTISTMLGFPNSPSFLFSEKGDDEKPMNVTTEGRD